ncbi:MAG: SCO family protein [Chloroflexota bacterium]|nr:SCO family protein [Chloroflexota bacterium]
MIRRIVLALACAFVMAACGEDRLFGTELEKNAAPDFTLTDGITGKSLTLSSLRTNTVVLAFLYTRCPDVCPLTAGQFRAAQRSLGADASKVEFVAVSVDPEGDTPAAVREFSDLHDLSDRWHYLIGPRAQLEAVWSLYGIGSFASSGARAVEHNDAIYLIDGRGRERAILHSSDPTSWLLDDLRALISEGSG